MKGREIADVHLGQLLLTGKRVIPAEYFPAFPPPFLVKVYDSPVYTVCLFNVKQFLHSRCLARQWPHLFQLSPTIRPFFRPVIPFFLSF